MNSHALGVIEFPQVLALVADRASTSAGADRVRSLTPSENRSSIEGELSRVAAMRAVAESEAGWPAPPIPELASALLRLRAIGSMLSPRELLDAATLLRSSRVARDALGDPSRPAVALATLQPFRARLASEPAVEAAIEGAVDPDASIRDSASPLLRSLRRELRGAQRELVQLLERVMAKLDVHQRVADMSVTIRNGRYVIPVRREGKGAVGGIVHDESATRGTIFVEPPAAIEFGNRIRELEADEIREVDCILLDLTDRLRPLHEQLVDALDALSALDSLFARARFAGEFQCAPIALSDPASGFAIVAGRHPLLLARGGVVIPFDLEMLPGERTLLLSGPNTGGKTVLLKALGLLSAMAQSGIPVPVGAESRVVVVDDVFADIGDEQSIQASLSTFSAHLRNLAEILDRATPASLVLIDELGSGTDPTEGAALGGAILDELTGRGALTIATTHLGALKLVATENPGVINASLQFDEVALAPTYRLIKGIPGRSYGLSIARRLRLDSRVLDRAEQRLPHGERDVAALLSDLERRNSELELLEQEAAEAGADLAARLEQITERERRTRDAERSLERRAREDTRRFLLDARSEVDAIIAALRQGASDEGIRDARRRVEQLASEQGEALERMDTEDDVAAPVEAATDPIEPGALVEVETLGGRPGQLVELRGKDAVVIVGAMKLTVPTATLRRSSARTPAPAASVHLVGSVPDEAAATEIDLRGMRVDEMERSLLSALDAAVRSDLKSIRIIHGKGTGALRDRVGELLRGDGRVRAFRWGAWNEGGAGVTVAELG
ncbi:MAG: Smr/MutS family protein [Gemmatimonadota bacterium]|nr:Smr/MutS family protein [Gemmatimonadota bacterium]